MFDVGFLELALIGVVALVIVGPQRLPGVAYNVGLWVNKVRSMLRDVKADIRRELREQNVADLGTLKRDLEEAGGQFKDATEPLTATLSTKHRNAAQPRSQPTTSQPAPVSHTEKRATESEKSAASNSPTVDKKSTAKSAASKRYYLYQNQKKKYSTIHAGACRHCNDGHGRSGGSNLQHTQWHGPFVNLATARKQQSTIHGTHKECACATRAEPLSPSGEAT